MKYVESYITDSQNFRFFTHHWIPDTQPKGIVLLIHGLSDHGGRFAFVAESLAKEGYIFVAPDLRGNGKTDGKRGHFDSLDQILSDISFLLQESKQLYPGLPAILYSQSMGAGLAINFALRFPGEINCVVASSPWLRLTKQPPALLQRIVSKLARKFPSVLLPNGLKSKDLCHDPLICRAYDTDPLIHWKISLSTFFIINTAGEWAIQNAVALKIPLLLLHSQSDPITSYAASDQFYRNSNQYVTFIKYAGLFHELHNEPEKEEVIGKIVSWINTQLQK